MKMMIEKGTAGLVFGSDVRASLDQKTNYLRMTMHRCKVKRRISMFLERISITYIDRRHMS